MSKGVQKVLDQCKPRYRAPSKTEYVLLFFYKSRSQKPSYVGVNWGGSVR